jgi:putative transposase
LSCAWYGIVFDSSFLLLTVPTVCTVGYNYAVGVADCLGGQRPQILSIALTVEDGAIFVADIARCGIDPTNHHSRRRRRHKSLMAQTHTNLLYHIVFSTQGRLPLLPREMRPELFAYMGSLIKEKKGKPIIINGIEDHAHLLASFPPDVSVSDAMRFAKANSSRWMKQRFGKPFAWQKGFGAFSASRSNVDALPKYIRDQEAHHRKIDFQTEFVSLLDKNEAEYDPDHPWD